MIIQAFKDFGEKSSPRKSSSSSSWPVFVLFFECPLCKMDITFEPRKTEVEFTQPEEVAAFIANALKKALEEESTSDLVTYLPYLIFSVKFVF